MKKTTLNPTKITRPRSIFSYNPRVITTAKLGDIWPIKIEEVLPGDTFTIDVATVIRGINPFVSPVYGDAFIEIYAFWVPNRLVWDHWVNFCGQNDSTAGYPTTSAVPVVPKTAWTPLTSWNGPQSIGDYMGLPYENGDDDTDNFFAVNELPLRGYLRIWNEWFRDENTQSPQAISYGDNNQTEEGGKQQYSDACLKAARYHDYFSSALPYAQKGDAVSLPMGGLAPLSMGDSYTIKGSSSKKDLFHTTYQLVASSDNSQGVAVSWNNAQIQLDSTKSYQSTSQLYADLSDATAATINEWRLAFQTQIFLETMARGGSRYNELIKSLFGVEMPDNTTFRTEFLGALKFPLRMQEVVATSSSVENSDTQFALGQQVVKIATGNAGSLFTKSFTEHGFIHIYGVIRQKHQYSQSLARMWKRNEFLDYFNPIFDNIGETPVYLSELWATGSGQKSDPDEIVGQQTYTYENDEVYGYQEAWAEYRYFPDTITGYLRPNIQGNLTTYTWGDVFNKKPTLPGIIPETSYINRTMALTNLDYDFAIDIQFAGKVARTMSVRSIPGLLDHHAI